MHFIIVIIYLAFWFVLAEKNSIQAVVIGVIIVAMTAYFNRNLNAANSKTKIIFSNIKNWIYYVLILIKEIIYANIQVACVVLSPKIKITPKVVAFETKLKSEFCRTILANSITLTPGTLTVFLKENVLTVHCLMEDYADGLIDSSFEKILLKVEEKRYA